MTPIDWTILLNYYMRDERLHRSNVNWENKQRLPYASLHGRKSLVEIRDEQVSHFFLNLTIKGRTV